MIGDARISFGGDGAGLFVEVANVFQFLAAAEGIIQVHHAAAGEHENVFHALARDEIHDVMRKLYCGDHVILGENLAVTTSAVAGDRVPRLRFSTVIIGLPLLLVVDLKPSQLPVRFRLRIRQELVD
jgi:hypothetical protein